MSRNIFCCCLRADAIFFGGKKLNKPPPPSPFKRPPRMSTRIVCHVAKTNNIKKSYYHFADYGETIWKQIWIRCKLKLLNNCPRICFVVVWNYKVFWIRKGLWILFRTLLIGENNLISPAVRNGYTMYSFYSFLFSLVLMNSVIHTLVSL